MQTPIWTVAQPIRLSGQGLHSGQTVELSIEPRLDQAGFQFVRSDLTDLPPGANTMEVFDIDEKALPMRTVLKRGAVELHTVEHVLSALVGCGVGAATIRVGGLEVPGMDGSAQVFVDAIRQAGTQPLVGSVGMATVFQVTEPIEVKQGPATVRVLPFDGFKISYSLYYEGHPLAQGFREIDFGAGLCPSAGAAGRELYRRELAPARTFCMKPEAEMLRKAGFGKGATPENTLIVQGLEAVGTTLRFADEPVRHKMLDMLGDFATAGVVFRGHVVGDKSGHQLNRLAARKIREAAGVH